MMRTPVLRPCGHVSDGPSDVVGPIILADASAKFSASGQEAGGHMLAQPLPFNTHATPPDDHRMLRKGAPHDTNVIET